ncbi:MAG: DUF2188 domain-containing protein [Gammaproteobacteria bacterium]|nr:DUF2188 domain-containing protein [Gammaproteobacteria bacterium]MCY4226591.1 DUF2188 domain-containing protein [Gammaproteobacteria bacterium]
MKGKNQHVVPRAGCWAVKAAGNRRATSTHPTQRQAIKVAQRIARSQGMEMLVHGRNGRIRERSTYGRDPYPPKG